MDHLLELQNAIAEIRRKLSELEQQVQHLIAESAPKSQQPQTLITNQRADQRFPVHFRSVVSAATSDDSMGTGLDLSPCGCRIHSDTPIVTGMRLSLHIAVPGQSSLIHIQQAVVKWAGNQEFGVQFISLRSDDSERLRQVVETRVYP